MEEENKNIELPKMKDEPSPENNLISKDVMAENEFQKENDDSPEEKEDFQKEIIEFKEKTQKKNIVYNIVIGLLFITIFVWLGMWIYEYQNVSNGNDPKFCLKRDTISHDDGTVEVCTGLGYKVINYKRETYKAIEIGPFWIKERQNFGEK